MTLSGYYLAYILDVTVALTIETKILEYKGLLGIFDGYKSAKR